MTLRMTVGALLAAYACSPASSQSSEERCVIQYRGPGVVDGQPREWPREWKMFVLNDGAPCEIRREFGGAPATSITIFGQPKNGVLAVDAPTVRYTPNANFTGNDFFEVQWFGMSWGPYTPASATVRAKVEVTVREKRNDASPTQQ